MTWDGDGVLAGRYRRLGRIGQGGMGSVWRAHDIDLDRAVAVKELLVPEQVTDRQRLDWYARMEREARAAARLRHPGIVTVHDRVTGEDGRPWIVMELIEGRSLGDVLAEQGALPPHQVAMIGLAMLDALSAAHAQGVVHRDVKPANVLLEGDRVLLTDFGIAALEGDATITRSGMVLGTPAYMSPEQVEGKPVTPASDLWSLAATLYAAVEGRRPFEGPGHGAVFVAIATRQPPAPRCGGPLAQALDGLLRKNPDERLQPAQVRDLLDAALVPTADSNPGTVVDPTGGTGGSATDVGPRSPRGPLRTVLLRASPRERSRLLLVRAALVCTALSMLTYLVGPWPGPGNTRTLTFYSPETLLILPLPWIAALILLCVMWFRPRRPTLVVGLVAAILNGLHLEALVVYRYQNNRTAEAIDPNDVFELSWILGTLALMLAFTAMNPSLLGKVTSPPARNVLIIVAVLVEGMVALLWPGPVYGLAGSGLDILNDSFLDDSLFRSLLLLGAIWIGVQPFLWPHRGGQARQH
ncbi:serine/threonine-protein kinase [Actinomadura bangladeshensis]|uniref:non-specific serine/threonine protein kinase n=1 Tax=Actinomadura bangladeshensis TaxID=453573 RepID=A0A4R4PEV8_9ACTN|nr:serine/threonine-protein kinase [Actinomadura bangladeshensis]TDC19792.1 serine/threonine protein kinase [Actinomadura bangladeshensis]